MRKELLLIRIFVHQVLQTNFYLNFLAWNLDFLLNWLFSSQLQLKSKLAYLSFAELDFINFNNYAPLNKTQALLSKSLKWV